MEPYTNTESMSDTDAKLHIDMSNAHIEWTRERAKEAKARAWMWTAVTVFLTVLSTETLLSIFGG